MAIRYISIIVSLILLACNYLPAQGTTPNHDSTTSKIPPASKTINSTPQEVQLNSLGIDVLASAGGFGLGAFYRHEYSDDLSSYVDFSISEAGDDAEKEYIDYFGNRYVPGKVNRFLVLPLFVGLERRLFKDDIVDNFRPYINIAVGPSMIYVFPNNQEYFSAIGKGTPKYTLGGYAGFGAYFGTEHARILGLNIRYYYLPYPKGLEDLQGQPKKEFGGFYLTLNIGGGI
jgi:hypothetical protein